MGNRIERQVVWMLAGMGLCGWMAAAEGATGQGSPPHVLFHASFDKTADYADSGFGETREVVTPHNFRKYRRKERNVLRPGKFRGALFVPRSFQAHGNVCVRRGTAAFWFRQDQALGKTYYPILEIKTVEPYFWWRYLSIHGMHGKVHAELCDRDCRRHMQTFPRWVTGEWQHVAVAWDCVQGIRLYHNGKLAASNWGKDSWPAMGIYLEQIALPCRRGGAYDEVWVFAEPLTDAEIRQLYEKNAVETRAAPPARGDWRSVRGDELGWPRGAGLPVLADNGPLTAVSVPVQTAKGLKRWVWRGVDGKTGTYFPSNYQGYAYQDGGGCHLTFPGKRTINYMTISGRFRGDVFTGTELEKPSAQARLAAIEPEKYTWSHRFEPALQIESMSLFKRPLDRERTGNDNALGSVSAVSDRRARMRNLQLFELRQGRPAGAFTGEIVCAVGDDARLDYLPPWFAQALVGLYGAEERRAVLLSRGRARGSELSLTALRPAHLFTPPATEDTFLDAVTFEWTGGPDRPGAVRVLVRDPVTPTRELVSLDVRVTGRGRHELTLDHVDTIVPQGRRIWMTLFSEHDARLRDACIRLRLNDHKKVLAQYEPRQMGFIKDCFMYLSEPRPWGRVENRADAMFLGRVYRQLGEMYDALHEFRKHIRENRLANGIHIWTHPSAGHPRGSVGLRPEDEGAPRWAVYARMGLEYCLAMPHWWIDKRQVPNGEFGSNRGDDSDLVQDWPSLALITDPDHKLKRSLNAIGDLCWQTTIEDGLNRRTTDALHAYEVGINVQPHQALLSYGNPVYLERLMEIARAVEEKLMARTPNGHLHFRSWMYGAREVVTELRYGVDMTTNTLMLHPAMFLMYYNRNPRATQVCSEYVRSWFEDFYALGKKWPGGVRFENHEVQTKGRSALSGYGFVYLVQAVYESTRDPKILQTLRDGGVIADEGTSGYALRLLEWFRQMGLFQRNPDYLRQAREVDLSGLGTTALSDSRYDWKYLAWAVTGDKDYLAQAARRLAERMSVTLAMQTEAEQSADRVQLSKKLIDRMYLGGVAVQRNELWPRQAVSYEGLNGNFAALVLESSATSLRVLLYNFEDKPQTGRLRVWRLQNGTYRVRFGPDLNQDDKVDTATWEKTLPLRRYAPIELTLLPRRLHLIECRQTAKGDDLFKRADLAVAAEDATYDAATDALKFVVHNVGSATARNVAVEVRTRDGRPIKTFTIPELDAPLDLVPRRVAFTLTDVRAHGTVTILIDPEDKIPEICEENNRASIAAR